MFRTFLSFRYLRARKTNWIGMAGIFVAVAALVLILSIMAGFLAEHRRTLRGNLADLVIQPGQASFVDLPNGDRVEANDDIEELIRIVEDHPKVVSAAPQLQWYGLFVPDGADGVLKKPMQEGIELIELVGVDPEDEAETSDFAASLRRDFSPKPPDNRRVSSVNRVEEPNDPFKPLPSDGRRSARPPRPIIVGEQLAFLWSLYDGQVVSIITATFDEYGDLNEDAPANSNFQIVGSFRSKDNEMDQRRIYIDRREMHDFLRQTRSWSAVIVKLEDYERDKDVVREELWTSLNEAGFLGTPGVNPREFRTWEDFRATLLAAIENEKSLMGIMLSLVLVVAGFTVFALLSMMVTEKRRDIGILTALGATSRGVMTLFLLIGLWEAVIGSALGAAVGVLGAYKIDAIERWLSSTFGFQIFNRDIYLFDHIPSEVTPLGVGWIVLGAVVSTLVFAAIPAWRASRLDPVDALRHE
ncbi:MAG: FtsX-like permease family protein [Planctomycetota bacterium]